MSDRLARVVGRHPTNPRACDVSIGGDWPVGVQLGIRINHRLEDEGIDPIPIEVPP